MSVSDGRASYSDLPRGHLARSGYGALNPRNSIYRTNSSPTTLLTASAASAFKPPTKPPLRKNTMPHAKQDWAWAITPETRPGPPMTTLRIEQDPEPTPRTVQRGTSGPFHGVDRQFGIQCVDPRMRGGQLARDGWAGTFPCSHSRGVAPWA
eukprot:TRINITY_DN51899_c0_g1_i1.p1 TRINITY_DN51899_c0_g1~~TRINITY_DN51899_c0_g1_i1.p1  ORF type:complete len:152 (-),score=19.55 TRINITY_DN51899_c0_g1_i1:38-493(-)